jgi:hypothetical protein
MHRTVLHRTCTDPIASPPACVQTNVPGALPGGGAGAPAGEPLPKKKRSLAELMGECIVMLWKCFEAVKCIKGTFHRLLAQHSLVLPNSCLSARLLPAVQVTTRVRRASGSARHQHQWRHARPRLRQQHRVLRVQGCSKQCPLSCRLPAFRQCMAKGRRLRLHPLRRREVLAPLSQSVPLSLL